MNKLFIHLKTVFTHKYWVFKYCCKCGMPIRGLLHDMSKLSPSELIPNLKYIVPGKSPINVAKEKMDILDLGCIINRIILIIMNIGWIVLIMDVM